MDVQAILHVIRHDFLDDTITPYRWRAETLLRWLNSAQNEACRRQRLLVEEDEPAVTNITLVNGTGSYALHQSVHLLDRVVYQLKTIPKATKDQLDRIFPAWRQAEPGSPLFYLQNDLTIRLIPPPGPAEDSQILTVRAWRLPLAPLVEDADVPEIPSAYHEDLAYYVASRAFAMPDEDLRDTSLSREYMGEFDKRFGPPMSADVLAHKRREGPTSFVGNSHAYHGRTSTRVIGRDPFDFED